MAKIQHVFNSSLVSGPETLVLPNLRTFSHEIEIILLQETRLPAGAASVASYVKSMGYRFHEIPVNSRFDISAILKLMRLWRSSTAPKDVNKSATSPPDIIHCHGPKASLYSLIAGFLLRFNGFRPRFISTHHGVRANDQSNKLKLFEIIYEKLVIPFFDLTLTVCSSDLTLLNKRGISKTKLAIHLNGVDRKECPTLDKARNQELRTKIRDQWKEDVHSKELEGFLIGVVGRLSIEKQYDRILHSFSLLLKTNPSLQVKLLCFGSGPLETELKTLTNTLELTKHVYWMGYRPNVANEMLGLDLLLSLSSAEGLPINLIEAGWSGIPVIAQGVDGVKDLIENNRSGILLPPDSTNTHVALALENIITQPELAANFATEFQIRVKEKFSKNAWVSRLEEIYNVELGKLKHS